MAFTGRLDDVWRANLWLRTASRVVVRLAAFRAEAFYELERHARKVAWERFVAPGRPVRFRVTCRKSRLYHSDGVAERLVAAVAYRLGEESEPAIHSGAPDGPDTEAAEGDVADTGEGEGAQLFIVRIVHDRCTISADSSGALLHRRGYRQAVAKAPLRETLAAAMLLGSGWRGQAPLLDPMCGSGTLAVEAALLARGIAPGLIHPHAAHSGTRRFAFMEWPDFHRGRWDAEVDAAARRAAPRSPVPIQASDRDAGAAAAAVANAERAGVAADVEVATRTLSAVAPPPGPGWVVTNPPYGVRVGEVDRLRNLYAQLGNVARARCPTWILALLSASRELERQVRIPFDEVFHTSNGGIPVRLVVGTVPAESG